MLEIYRYGRIWRIKCTLLKNQKWSGRPHTIPLWSDIIKVHVPHFCASNLPQNCRISLLAEFWSLYDLIWVSRSWTKLRKPRRFCSNRLWTRGRADLFKNSLTFHSLRWPKCMEIKSSIDHINQNLAYHFHIPPYHTTPKRIKQSPNTSFIPVNLKHCLFAPVCSPLAPVCSHTLTIYLPCAYYACSSQRMHEYMHDYA